MALDPDLLAQLVGSIEAETLIVLCGAGLSIPPPSNLMSAARVSQACYDKYLPIAALSVALRDDIDRLAGHFQDHGQFANVFIKSLVPWNDLVGEPNDGHAACADFLICGAASAVLSANFDPLIEHWAKARKIALRGALTGQEAVAFRTTPSPLLKFHGCLDRGREDTLWTQGQLGEAAVMARVQSCSQWMGLNLPGKDLLLIGFWTDWGYLDGVLANAMNTLPFHSVTVIDPQDDATLLAKAPNLWTRLTGGPFPFRHVEISGNEALSEIRAAFSKTWGRRFLNLADPLLQAEGKALEPATVDALDALSCDELYDLRRDGEGVPYDRAARTKTPPSGAGRAAQLRALLAQAGATPRGAWYVHNGQRIRIVHGDGQVLGSVCQRYKEPPSIPEADIIVAAGAIGSTVPGALISSGSGKSIVRPAHGGSSRWLNSDDARTELGV